MTKTVWTLESGFYRYVHGVYSTKERAERAKAALLEDKYEPFSIVEHTLDPLIEALDQGYTLWYIDMGIDGEVQGCRDESDYVSPDFAFKGLWRVNGSVIGHVWARDGAHAVEIATEML